MSEKKEKHDKNEEVEEQEEQPEEIVIEREPPQGSTDEEKQYWLRRLPIRQGCFDSPIDLNLVNCIPISLPKLEWVNFDAIPKKTKLTNSGHTMRNGLARGRTSMPDRLLRNMFFPISIYIGEKMHKKEANIR